MVVDNRRSRSTDGQSGADRADRGQVILIGAIALAFIILGVVVVFNGVIYTETLSSGNTGQSASAAETTELEITHGVGCILSNSIPSLDIPETENNIEEFGERYQNATAESKPVAVTISGIDVFDSPVRAEITISYDSESLSYEQERTITPNHCPANT